MEGEGPWSYQNVAKLNGPIVNCAPADSNTLWWCGEYNPSKTVDELYAEKFFEIKLEAI